MFCCLHSCCCCSCISCWSIIRYCCWSSCLLLAVLICLDSFASLSCGTIDNQLGCRSWRSGRYSWWSCSGCWGWHPWSCWSGYWWNGEWFCRCPPGCSLVCTLRKYSCLRHPWNCCLLLHPWSCCIRHPWNCCIVCCVCS